MEEGISQLAKGAESGFFTSNNDVNPCVWNFPIDIAFKSLKHIIIRPFISSYSKFGKNQIGCSIHETNTTDRCSQACNIISKQQPLPNDFNQSDFKFLLDNY